MLLVDRPRCLVKGVIHRSKADLYTDISSIVAFENMLTRKTCLILHLACSSGQLVVTNGTLGQSSYNEENTNVVGDLVRLALLHPCWVGLAEACAALDLDCPLFQNL